MKRFMTALMCLLLLFTTQLALAQGEQDTSVITRYAQMLIDGHYEASEALLDEGMLQLIEATGGTEAFLEANLYPVTGKLLLIQGDPESAGDQQDFDIYTLGLMTEVGAFSANFYLTEEGLIAGYNMQPVGEPPIEMPAGFLETPVTVDAGEGYPLKGRIVKPADSAESVPAVILIQGSGATDYDEIVGANRVFGKLAKGLADRGIATLRYTKRNYAYPEIMQQAEYSIDDEYLRDVDAAVELMRREPGIDPSRIFILGHSQGGMLAPVFMKNNEDLAGMILFAGTPRNFVDIMIDQVQNNIDYYQRTDAYPDEVEALKTMSDDLKKRKAALAGYTAEEALAAEPIGNYTAYYLYKLHQYDLIGLIEEAGAPTLIMQGARDQQVYIDKDYPVYVDALSDDAFVTMKTYEDLSHLFTPSKADSIIEAMSEYMAVAEIPQRVFDDIAGWIESIK